jgi:preprotein translocase subunit SecY
MGSWHFVELIAFGVASYVAFDLLILGRLDFNQKSFREILCQIRTFFARSDLQGLLANRSIQKRLLITIVILAAYVIGLSIPLTGIDTASLYEVFPVGASLYVRLSILALGLMPYLSASGLLHLLSFVVPYLRRLYHGGESRTGVINRDIILLTLCLAVVQGIGLTAWWARIVTPESVAAFPGGALGFRIVGTAVLVAGTFLLVWCTKLIDAFGVGNGVGLLVATSMVCGIVTAISKTIGQPSDLPRSPAGTILLVAFILVTVIAGVGLTIRKSVVRVGFNNTCTNRRTVVDMPFRPSWAGTVPLGLALTIAATPGMLTGPLRSPAWRSLLNSVGPGTWIGTVIVAILTVLIARIYVPALFTRRAFTSHLKRYGGELASDPDEYALTAVLDARLRDLITLSAFTLVWFTIASKVVRGLSAQPLVFVAVGSLPRAFIVAAVICDTIERMKAIRLIDGKSCKYVNIFSAFTEVEACIKQGFLRSQGIDCIIDPVRFSWGIPIKTSLDRYNVYVPEDEVERGVALLLEKREGDIGIPDRSQETTAGESVGHE